MGSKNHRHSITAGDNVRHQAEELLHAESAAVAPPRTEDEALRLVHELQVHQIELELQNAELRRARNEVESLLERFTDLYDFAPVGYFTLDRNGVIRAVNLNGAQLCGVERSRLTGQRFCHFVAAGSRSIFTALLNTVFTSPAKSTAEVELLREGATPLFVHIEAVAGTMGEECRIAVIDISEQRRTEDELSGKRLELEELNRSLETRIARAVDDLRQKDRMMILQDRRAVMGEMINNIAHQWRQPLNLLGLRIQLLPISFAAGELSRALLEETTGDCMKLIEHMSQTIDGFRNFFKADKETVAFSVKQLIGHTLTFIEQSFREQQIAVVVETTGDPVITGYPNEYAQVVLNILMNARDALVARKIVNARISLQAGLAGNKTVVTISDNAGGIATDIIDRIFDPYFTTKGPELGTGIGLFMSKIIVEKNMGGSLTVHNSEEGAMFRIEV